MVVQSKEKVERISMLAWGLWKNRNTIVWEQKSMAVTEVVDSALLSLNQLKSAQDRSFDSSLGFMTQADGHEHWEQPLQGTVKINNDAAIFDNLGCYSYSMIVRDHQGEMMEARSSCKPGDMDPFMAEAISIREALGWVKKKECMNVAI